MSTTQKIQIKRPTAIIFGIVAFLIVVATSGGFTPTPTEQAKAGEIDQKAVIESQQSSLAEEKKKLETELKIKDIESQKLDLEKSKIDLENSLKEEVKVSTDQVVKPPVEAQKLIDDKTETPPTDQAVDRVMGFLSKRKHNYTREYVQIIYDTCGKNQHSLYSIVAISGHETAFGTAGSPVQGYPNNFWGWGYNGATRTYMSGDYQFMANSICLGFREGARYYTMISTNGDVNFALAKLYSGNDRATIWSQNVGQFYKEIIK